MKIIIYFFLTFLTFSSVSAQLATPIRFDPDNAFGGTSSQIFNSVKFIPLETTKQSLFGKISQLEITDNYFIITDFDTWSVLIFEKSGKFHAKIRKRSENEYFSSITLDKKAKQIIMPIIGDKVLIYNFDGKLIGEHDGLKNAQRMFYFNSQSIAYHVSRPLKWDKKDDTRFDLSYSIGFNNVTKSFLQYKSKFKQYEYNLPNVLFNNNNDGSCFFTFPYEYTINQLNENGIIHQYKFLFPQKYSLPPNFASDSLYAGKRKDYVFSSPVNTGKFTTIVPFFKMNNYLIFHLEQIGVVYGDNDNFLYSLKAGRTYKLNKITGDSSSSFIPVLDSHFRQDLLGIDNDHMYTSISPILLFEIKASSNKKTVYSPELENLFTKGTPKDNPVIIESVIKNNL